MFRANLALVTLAGSLELIELAQKMDALLNFVFEPGQLVLDLTSKAGGTNKLNLMEPYCRISGCMAQQS